MNICHRSAPDLDDIHPGNHATNSSELGILFLPSEPKQLANYSAIDLSEQLFGRIDPFGYLKVKALASAFWQAIAHPTSIEGNLVGQMVRPDLWANIPHSTKDSSQGKASLPSSTRDHSQLTEFAATSTFPIQNRSIDWITIVTLPNEKQM